MKTRIVLFDYTKAILILLMILGHVLQRSDNSYFYSIGFGETFFSKFIYSFNMPLLLMMSGYFFCDSLSKYNAKSLLKNKITSLLYPHIFFTSIVNILLLLLFLITRNNGIFNLQIVISNYFLYFWFTINLFISFIIIYFVEKLFNKGQIVIFVLLIILMFLPEIFQGMTAFALCNVYTGYLIRKYNIYFLNNIKIFLLCSIIFIISLNFIPSETFIYKSGYSIIKNNNFFFMQIFFNILRMIMSLISSYFFINLINYIQRYFSKLLSKILIYVSRYSIYYYFLSSIITSFGVSLIAKMINKGIYINTAILFVYVVTITTIANFLYQLLKRRY